MTSNPKCINSQFYNNYSKYFKNYKPNNQTNNEQLNNNQTKQKYNNYPNVSIQKKEDKQNEDNKRHKNSFNLNFNFDHINILGIDLFFDDILLILLIYFLYTQGVTDIYLFIVLILLLLS